MTDDLLTGFDYFNLTFDLIISIFQILFIMRMQIMSAIAMFCFLESAVEADKLIDISKN